MKLKKDSLPFAAGMATMMLLIGLVTGSLAAEDEEPIFVTTGGHPVETVSGQPLKNIYGDRAGVALFGWEQLKPGTTRTTEQGVEVPAVLTYVDDKGTAHEYIAVETVAEVLDVAMGVTWNEELKCVDFGSEIMTQGKDSVRFTAEPDFPHQGTVTQDGSERVFVGSGPVTYNMNGVTITVGGSVEEDLDSLPPDIRERQEARIKERNEKLRADTPLTPEFGVTRGALTEVSVDEVDQGSYMGSFLDKELFQSENEVTHDFYFAPIAGTYAAVTVENLGGEDVLVRMERPCTVGDGPSQECMFTRVRIPAGKRLTRYFRLEDASNLALQSRLSLEAQALDNSEVQIKLSAEQYRSGTVKK